MSGTNSNPFDQFDAPAAPAVAAAPASPQGNPFDQFDAPPTATALPADVQQAAMDPHAVAGRTGSMVTDIPRIVGTAAAQGVGGLLGLPRVAAQGVDFVAGKMGYHPGADAALASVQLPNGQQLFQTPDNAAGTLMSEAGATQYVAPTALGRDVQAGLATVPSALLTGPEAVLPSIVGGATAEAAGEAVPDHPALARALGFAFGAHSASSVANTMTKAAAMATGAAPTSELFQAYQRQGVPTTLSGDVTQNPTLQRLQSIATKMPGGEEAMREAGGEALSAWQEAAERNASLLGPAATMQDAGTGLQNATQQWLQSWKQGSADKWNAFRQAVPGTTPIPVSSFQQALDSVNHDFGGADGLAKALQPQLASRLKDALGDDISPQGTLPWQSVQAVRSRLGEMMEPGQPVSDMAQSAIKRLYGGLSDDMRNGASSVSPAAAQAYNQANAYTAFGHSLIDDHLAPIINATNPEAAAQYAFGQAKRGGSRLAAIDFAAPGQAANLGAAKLRMAAENGPGALPTMLKNISPEAQQSLFTSQNTLSPGAVDPAFQGVGDLSNIAQAMRRTVQTTGNNSNTAAHEASGLGRVMVAGDFAKEGHEMAGLPGAIAGAALGLGAPSLVGSTARMIAANPLLSRMYSTQAAPFSTPAMFGTNALSQVGATDRRKYLLDATSSNPLRSVPGVTGSVATMPR